MFDIRYNVLYNVSSGREGFFNLNEVIALSLRNRSNTPPGTINNINPGWREVTNGTYKINVNGVTYNGIVVQNGYTGDYALLSENNTAQIIDANIVIDLVDFGSKVKYLRRNNGVNQSDFAAMLDVSAATVAGWEKGERKPRKPMIKVIAEILNVPADWLMESINV